MFWVTFTSFSSTVRYVNISGLSNCSWTSCREGCTREYYECHHIKVEYLVAEEEYQTRSEKQTSYDSSPRTASLYVNVKGCGYPPTVQCDKWISDYGMNNTIIPCHYSRTDHSLAITHLDTKSARKDVLLSLLLPLVTILLSGSALFLLHKRCFKLFDVETILERYVVASYGYRYKMFEPFSFQS